MKTDGIDMRRIVTFMAIPRLPIYPMDMLRKPGIYTAGDKRRWFATRTVHYREGTPIYSMPDFHEKWYGSLQELKEYCPKELFDHPILQTDNYMKTWEEKT